MNYTTENQTNIENNDTWTENLHYTKGEVLKSDYHNLMKIFLNDKRLKGKIKYNVMTGIVQNLEPLPFKSNTYPWEDAHITMACSWLTETPLSHYIISEPNDKKVHAVIEAVAMLNPYDPLADYLKPLEWDGEKRLESMFAKYFGAKDEEYSSMVGLMMMFGAVNRALRPGNQFDYMTILIGPQGCRKTSAMRTLFEPFYAEMTGTKFDKESLREIQGRWCIEIAELKQFLRSDSCESKSFITGTHDNIRMPYDRMYKSYPRRCILVGTTNNDSFLRDETGNRRYLPIRVDNIEVDALGEIKDQLFAEAIERSLERTTDGFNQKTNIYLPPRQEKLAIERQRGSEIDDAWADDIEHLVEDKFHILVKEITDHLDIEIRDMNNLKYARISSIMIKLGFEYKRMLTKKYNIPGTRIIENRRGRGWRRKDKDWKAPHPAERFDKDGAY